jgi:hypothetical protein
METQRLDLARAVRVRRQEKPGRVAGLSLGAAALQLCVEPLLDRAMWKRPLAH